MAAFKNILVPLDYSVGGDAALRQAMALARDVGARLLVIHVVPPYDPAYFERVRGSWSPDADTEAKEQAKLSKHVAKLVTPARVRYETEMRWGDPAQMILATAEKRGTDLIVIGRNGRTGWDRLLMGSVAEKVAHHASCPVLIVHPPGASRSGRTRRASARPRRSRRTP
jgi:nucleotide-binding universal stress UspA family protein